MEWSENESKDLGKQSEVKETMVMLSHAILVLGKGCDTLLTSARPPHSPLSFTLPWTYSDLTTPVQGYVELCTTLVFDHTYLYTLPMPGLLCACVYCMEPELDANRLLPLLEQLCLDILAKCRNKCKHAHLGFTIKLWPLRIYTQDSPHTSRLAWLSITIMHVSKRACGLEIYSNLQSDYSASITNVHSISLPHKSMVWHVENT